MHSTRLSVGLTVLSTLVGLVGLVGVAGCSSGDSTEGVRETSVGSSVLASHEEGNKIVSSISSSKTDDSLTITFDPAARTAKLTPKFGQAKTITLDAVPGDVDAANRYVGDALTRGTNAAQPAAPKTTGAATGVTPQTFAPPPAECLHTCYGSCDEAFPNACQNPVCRFGCYVGCTSK